MKRIALVSVVVAALICCEFIGLRMLRAQATPNVLNFSTILAQPGDSDTATLQKHLTQVLKAHAAVVTPADGADLPHAAVELWVGVGGNIKVDMLGGETGIIFTAVPIGRFPYAVKRVYATGTTATTMIALY